MKKVIVAIFLFAAASSAFAATGSTLSSWYILPAVAHIPGNYGTFWETDVAIVNPYAWRSITVQIWYHPINQDNTNADMTSVIIGPGDQVTLPDVVLQRFGVSNGSGALWLQTDDDAYFSVNARTYTGTLGTYGLMENGQRSVTSGSQSAFISGVKNGSGFRSNVGAANASSRSVRVLVEAYDNDGRFKGEETLTLEPWGMTQIAVDSFAGTFADGYLVLTGLSSSDAQWVGYATPIDNNSGDSTFCEARTDAQYTWARPQHDIWGWWEGSVSTSQGSNSGYMLVDQNQSIVRMWLYYTDGNIAARFEGFEDRGAITLTGYRAYQAQCLDSEISGGNIISDGGAIYGNITFSASDSYYCLNGTATFFFEPMSYDPFKKASGNAEATAGSHPIHGKRLGKGAPKPMRRAGGNQ